MFMEHFSSLLLSFSNLLFSLLRIKEKNADKCWFKDKELWIIIIIFIMKITRMNEKFDNDVDNKNNYEDGNIYIKINRKWIL